MSKFLLAVFVTMLIGATAGCVQSDDEGRPTPQELEDQLMSQEPDVTAEPVATLEPVSAGEMYKLFLCPCCGGTIDRDCCGASFERKNYVDGLIDEGLSKEEIVVEMALKYGINSLIHESDKEEVREELIKRAPKNRPRILIGPDVIDLGNVSVTKGEVRTVVYVQNVGIDDLVISGMDSSCGCTTAALVVDGREGPRFSMAMHGTNPVGWSQTLTRGQRARLMVYYNTTFHSDFRGPATRIITVFSNDPVDFAKEVRIELNQVD